MTARIALIRFIAFWLLVISTAALARNTTIGPLAVLLVQQQAHATTVDTLRKMGLVHFQKGTQILIASTLVRFQGDLSGIAALGAQVKKTIGDVASIDVPVGKLIELSQLPNIIYTDLAIPLSPALDLAVPATGPTMVRRSTMLPDLRNVTGLNVAVGVIDSGIDLKHSDFRDQYGKSRILHLFDDTTGLECTPTQIDAGVCGELDTDGHGTHVAGIAAGNGSATGNGQPAYRYVGIAPEAGLIIYKHNWTTASLVDGLEDIEEVAGMLGKPVVINISCDTEIGPHDGTDNTSRALDNASGPGRIVVVAAGNSVADQSHASATVSQGTTTTLNLTAPPDTTFTAVDIWYPGSDQIAIDVSNGVDCDTGSVSAPVSLPYTKAAFCENRILVESQNVNPLNGDREILVMLSTTTDNPFATATWNIELQGTVVNQGTLNAWVNGTSSGSKFTTHVSASETIGSFAAATQPITVAAYNTQNTWDSLVGPISMISSNPLGEISYFSSQGPRRRCSDFDDCPAVQKPDITAPGAWIMSSYSAQTQWPDGSCSNCYIDLDGVHSAMQGTSMSAPMVSGAVALLLQVAPNATPVEIKKALEGSTIIDDFTGVVPNNTWGYGKLDVESASNAIQESPPAAPSEGGGGAISILMLATLGFTLAVRPSKIIS